MQPAPNGLMLTAVARRSFLLVGTAAVGSTLVFASGFTATMPVNAGSAPYEFIALSKLATGRSQLDAAAGLRAWTQLVALDPAFPSKVAALVAATKHAGVASMAAFMASSLAQDSALRATMRTVVSAWYLGYTGVPVAVRANDTTGFVTYRGAMMFAPTVDATVLPTYARAGPDYWIDPPAGTPSPPGPPARRDWAGDTDLYPDRNFQA